MLSRLAILSLIVGLATLLPAKQTRAEGLGLGETKEELKLDYEVEMKEHKTGRVTLTLTIADEGRLKPLTSVALVIGNTDGTNYVDLSVALKPREVDGKQQYRVHIHESLAKRAEISLRTGHLDGKQEKATWYFHDIPLAKQMKTEK